MARNKYKIYKGEKINYDAMMLSKMSDLLSRNIDMNDEQTIFLPAHDYEIIVIKVTKRKNNLREN